MSSQVHSFAKLGPENPFGCWRNDMIDRLKFMRMWRAVERLPAVEGADPLPEAVLEAQLAEDEQALSVIRLG